MASTIQVDKITDIGGNTIIESNGSGTFTSNLPASAPNVSTATGTLPIANGGTGAATLAAAGLTNAPYFYAFRSGNQTGVSSSTWTTVINNSEVVDSENSYNTSTGQWTPSVAGYYQINTMITAIPDSDVTQLMIAIKASSHSDPRYANFLKLGSANINRFSGAVSGIVYLNGSQTVESRVYIVGQGGSLQGEVQYTNFSGYRIIT